jgi:ketopantoate reductase
VDNADRLSAVLSKGKIFNGCVYIGSRIVRPGVVQQSGLLNRLYLGNESDDETEAKNIENLLKETNMDAQHCADIKHVVWEKYVLISAFATATTFLEKTMRGVLDSKIGKALLDNLLTEVFHVTEATEINLPKISETTSSRKSAPSSLQSKPQCRWISKKETIRNWRRSPVILSVRLRSLEYLRLLMKEFMLP